MQWFAQEIARLAREIQRDLADLPTKGARSNGSNGSAESVESAQRLERIERKLESVHEDTGELIRRVPEDIGGILADLKQTMLMRLEAAFHANESNEPVDSGAAEHANGANHSNRSPAVMVKSLTPQERRIFQLCFESGLLTYREIAGQLDITPSAAKNLVNRMFQSGKKRPLFAKQYRHGSARIGICPDLEKQILSGAGKKALKPESVVRRNHH